MELWTREHTMTLLPALAVMTVAAIALRKWLGGKEYRVRMIPVQIIAVLLVLLEIGKQVDSICHGYDLYHIPLHYCSLVLVMLPVMAFYRGKAKEIVRSITCGVCMAVTLLTVIYPNLIYSAGNISGYWEGFQNFHTVTFHNLAIFATLLMLALDVYLPGKQGGKALTLFMLGFCLVSATAAQLLQTNYNNFYTCNIPPLEQLRQIVEAATGALVAKLLYVLIVTALDIAFTLGAFALYKLLAKLLPVKTEVRSHL